EKHSLWRSVIKEFYGECGGFNYANIPPGNSGIWMDVLKAIRSIEDIDSNFKSSVVCKVVSSGFMRLKIIKSVKSRTGGVWPTVFEGAFGIGGIRGNTSLSPSGRDKCAHALGMHHNWNSWIPRKVNVCVWRASLNRLATRVNLVHRGINISDVACPFCDIEDEDVNHVLISCYSVLPVWRKVWSWWNLEPSVSFSSFSIGYVAGGNMFGSGDFILAKILHGVFQIAFWVIWSWRNRVVNAPLEKVDSLKRMMFSQASNASPICGSLPVAQQKRGQTGRVGRNTLAEYMILFGADNRPPMLDNDLYDSWKSRMELYMQNKEQGRMILESVENCPLIWPTIKENGVTRTKKYAKLSDSS
ncbi:RNA-directed DNA polymerase, eukaryota, reverse transcriptase zinc-binding domain protein, partial [Tanacetum coccineum]